MPRDLHALLDLQHGVFARWQAPRAGLDPATIDGMLRCGRWQPLYCGVYATFTGPPARVAVLWAATLRAGPDAFLSHQSAAELDGLSDRPGMAVHVTIPVTRRRLVADRECRNGLPRVIVHRLGRIEDVRHPSRRPPRTRIEETTIDLTQSSADVDEALSWLFRAFSRRLTTPELLLAAVSSRSKLRWRKKLAGALTDSGIQSILEWRYVRGVERCHGLPAAQRQQLSRVGTRTRYLDNHYREFGVAVELDGRAAHPPGARWRDIHRDNASATAGLLTLRYNWADVTQRPCEVAAEIAAVLQQRGWPGRPRPCGHLCFMITESCQ